MVRILAFLVLIAACGLGFTDKNRGLGADQAHAYSDQRVCGSIDPAGDGGCALDQYMDFVILSDRVVYRDENDTDDDFQVSEAPQTIEHFHNLIAQAISRPASFIAPTAVPTWHTPLRC